MLNPRDAVETASYLYHHVREKERKRLERIQKYITNDGALAWLPLNSPTELQALSRMSRLPVADLVIKSTTQSLFVDSYKSSNPDADNAAWDAWQLNKWDRKQIGVHRSACSYGAGYAIALPGNPVPVLRPVSPLKITVAYSWGNDDFPEFALEDLGKGVWRLYDDTQVYVLRWNDKPYRGSTGEQVLFDFEDVFEHGSGFCPVVRYLADVDLDDPVTGDIEPLIPVIDQLHLTTFHLMTAQHYGAHGRKVIIGEMIKGLENQMMAAGANTTMTINANPDDVKLEQFDQTQLDGFIESRKSVMELIGAVSQTPTDDLLGSIANLSAAALQESRESTDRKLAERQMTFGESHEQLLGSAASLQGFETDPLAEVKWKQTRPTRQRELVDLLVVLSEKFDVPREALLEHLPFSYSDIEEFRNAGQSTVSSSVESPEVTEIQE